MHVINTVEITTSDIVITGDELAPLPVYLIHWNAPEWLRSSIDSLRSSVGCDLSIVVIDNSQNLGPTFDPEITLITPPSNDGYTGGANRALADATTRFPDATEIVIAAHDVHVEPGSLARLRHELHTNPACGIAGPVLLAPAVSYGGTWDGRRAGRLTEPGEPQWLSGTLMMIRRACSDDLGLFDTSFGSYSEDVDYGLRAKDKGWALAAVSDANAWGLGSVAEDVHQRIDITNLRVAVKRSGRRVLLRELVTRFVKLARVASISQSYGLASKMTRADARVVARCRTSELRAILPIAAELFLRPGGAASQDVAGEHS